MIRAVVIVSAVVVLGLGLLWAFQRRLVYFPAAGPVEGAGSVIRGAREVRLETSDGLALHAWSVPAREPARAVTVLVANGNAGDRSLRAPLARALAAEGLAVLLFDYRGYGGNPGHPSEEGLALDVRAAREYLVREAGVPASRIVYFGESLGAAVVTELAAEHPPGGLVLRSPFVDLASVGQAHYPFLPVRPLLRDRFPLTRHLARVTAPVTVVYGGHDSIVSPAQSRAVAESTPVLHDVVEVTAADHNDRALLDGDDLVDAVVEQADRISRS